MKRARIPAGDPITKFSASYNLNRARLQHQDLSFTPGLARTVRGLHIGPTSSMRAARPAQRCQQPPTVVVRPANLSAAQQSPLLLHFNETAFHPRIATRHYTRSCAGKIGVAEFESCLRVVGSRSRYRRRDWNRGHLELRH